MSTHVSVQMFLEIHGGDRQSEAADDYHQQYQDADVWIVENVKSEMIECQPH